MPRLPRQKRKPRNETPEARAARIARLKPVKPGERRNAKGINGSYWLNQFKTFAAEVTAAMAKEDGAEKVPEESARVDRMRNVFQAFYRNCLSGNQAAIDKFIAIMGINPADKLEVTGADGAALGTAVVLFEMGDAATAEDPAAGSGAAPPAPADDLPPSDGDPE